MPLQLIAPRERFPTSGLEARVLALGRVHPQVFRQVGRFRKGGGTAGEGAREGSRTGVRALSVVGGSRRRVGAGCNVSASGGVSDEMLSA